MASVNCPECGFRTSDQAQKCPNCNFPVKSYFAMQKGANSYRMEKGVPVKKADIQAPPSDPDPIPAYHPQTQKKKKHPVMGVVLFVIGGFIALSAFASMLGGGSSNNRSSGRTSSPAAGQQSPNASVADRIYHTGNTVQFPNGKITMMGYETSDGGDYFQPDTGNEYLFVEFEMENNTSETQRVSSWVSFDGYADGYKVDTSLTAPSSSGKNTLDGEIAAGMKMQGIVAFETPKNWKTFDIYYKDNVWYGERIQFEINR